MVVLLAGFASTGRELTLSFRWVGSSPLRLFPKHILVVTSVTLERIGRLHVVNKRGMTSWYAIDVTGLCKRLEYR